MSRSKRMKPVMQVAENREQQAARDLGAAQQQLAVQERKLEELQTYRDQYAQQFQQTGGGGIDAVRLQDYRVFLARLNQAVDQQKLVIERCQQECEKQRRQWMATRTRTQALDKVVERYRDEERREAEQQEQRDTDERAQRPRGGKH